MKYFKFVFYLVVTSASFAANAGSYEDFFASIQRDNPFTMRALLERGFDPNTPDPNGQTGFALALRAGSTRVAQLLADHPAFDVNALNAAGESPLMLAAIKGELALCRQLIGRGAELDKPGWAPLHYAASGPSSEIVDLLLERGAAVDAGSPNATTPLMMAARYGNEASVLALLARGADPERRNQLGLTAIDFATDAGRPLLADQLRSARRPVR